MNYWHIFLAFLISNLLGYGGGPSTIPLIEFEVVNRYAWLSDGQFAEVLALGNALPSPIATKMAGYIGFEQGGVLGSIIAVLATVVPSIILMIALTNILYKHKDSPKVKLLTMLVRPTIAVLLGLLTYKFFSRSYVQAGWMHTGFLAVASYVLIQKLKVHPALVIAGSIFYGAFLLA